MAGRKRKLPADFEPEPWAEPMSDEDGEWRPVQNMLLLSRVRRDNNTADGGEDAAGVGEEPDGELEDEGGWGDAAGVGEEEKEELREGQEVRLNTHEAEAEEPQAAAEGEVEEDPEAYDMEEQDVAEEDDPEAHPDNPNEAAASAEEEEPEAHADYQDEAAASAEGEEHEANGDYENGAAASAEGEEHEANGDYDNGAAASAEEEEPEANNMEHCEMTSDEEMPSSADEDGTETFKSIHDELVKCWVNTEVDHHVSKAASNSFWKVADKCFHKLYEAKEREGITRKVPQFMHARKKIYEKMNPEISMQVAYKHKETGEITVVDSVDSTPASQYPPNVYTKIFEVASVEVINYFMPNECIINAGIYNSYTNNTITK